MSTDGRDAAPILLFGAAGQLGLELHRALAPLGRVVPLSRAEADLTDAALLRRIVRAARPRLIVNAAAYNAVDRAESEEALAFAVNGEAPGVLAEEARALDAAFIHYSTDFVFGGEANRDGDGRPLPWRETDLPDPPGAYARSKLAGECAVAAAGGVRLVLRTSWVFSRRSRTFLGQLLRGEAAGPELRVVCDEISAPTWAPSLADATALLLAAAGWTRGGTEALAPSAGLYHLAGSGGASRYDFAVATFAILAGQGRSLPALQPVASAAFPTPARRPAFSVLDCSRLYAAFGIALPDWRESLAQCLAR